jgi:hypothetical protein
MKKFLFSLIICFWASVAAFSADYYWVAGGGYWSELKNWRLADGAIPSVIPSRNDNVFFDEKTQFIKNSEVYINVDAECNNITLSGAAVPARITGNKSLSIYGSSEWQIGSKVDVYHTNYMDTGTPKTIKSNGVVLGGNGYINFYETTSITLLDEFSSYRDVIQNAGTFNTNGFRVNIGNSFIAKGNSIVNIASSEIYLKGGNGAFDTSALGVTVNATDSHIVFEGVKNGGGLLGNSQQVYNNVTFVETSTSATNIRGGITANKVKFAGNGRFSGANIFNELILASGGTYTFEALKTQTIKQKFTVGLACSGWTSLLSDREGRQATISMPAGAVIDVVSALMNGINAIGGATFVAEGSIDHGNNTGWTFSLPSIQDLYWVGGAGSWNDPAHWSLTSGGVGGACVPGPSDNVFFDANSGFTSTSNTVEIGYISYFKDFTASGMATPFSFTRPSGTGSGYFEIYGSTVWQSGMKVISSLNYRDTGTPKTITSNGVTSGYDINFYETTSITLLDDFYCGYTLTQYAGTWNTNGNRVEIKRHYMAEKGAEAINLGSSKVYLHSGDSYFNTSKLKILDAGTSEIIFDKAMALSWESSSGIVGANNQKYYDVTFSDPQSTTGPLGRLAKMVFNKVEYAGSGTIGGHTIKELILAPGKNYTITSAETLTVTDKLTVGKACAGWANLSPSSTAAAVISMPAGSVVDVNGAIMKNILATGGANFVAKASIDEGGNIGWSFVSSPPKNLYWVGGAGDWNDLNHWSLTSGGVGGACVPGLSDDVFFDVNSGFTESSKIVDVKEIAYCRNITVAGTVVPPELKGEYKIPLNIYGSSVWQKGMIMSMDQLIYKNTGEAKTITDNGMLQNWTFTDVIIEETNSISFLSDFTIKGFFNQKAGIVNTNNFTITVSSYLGEEGTLNMGASDLYITNGSFNVLSPKIVVNAGTSHIHFTANLWSVNSSGGLKGRDGLVFNDVTFENSSSIYDVISYDTNNIGNTSTTYSMKFRKVEFRSSSATIYGSNVFDELVFLGDKYKLHAAATQTINKQLTMGGTACVIMYFTSSKLGTQANLNILNGGVTYDFSNVMDINFSGLNPHFGSQSVVANQNNTNLTFDPYDPTGLAGLGDDWLCHIFYDNDPDSYTLSAAGYLGNEYTKYSWTKVGDPNYVGVLGTGETFDVRPFGYGTYRVEVVFYNGAAETCRLSDEILIQGTPPMEIAPTPMEICMKGSSTRISDVTNLPGENIKWYETATSTTTLPDSTLLVDGKTYYLSQTKDGCESGRVALTISLMQCNKAVYMNPSLRLRVKP